MALDALLREAKVAHVAAGLAGRHEVNRHVHLLPGARGLAGQPGDRLGGQLVAANVQEEEVAARGRPGRGARVAHAPGLGQLLSGLQLGAVRQGDVQHKAGLGLGCLAGGLLRPLAKLGRVLHRHGRRRMMEGRRRVERGPRRAREEGRRRVVGRRVVGVRAVRVRARHGIRPAAMRPGRRAVEAVHRHGRHAARAGAVPAGAACSRRAVAPRGATRGGRAAGAAAAPQAGALDEHKGVARPVRVLPGLAALADVKVRAVHRLEAVPQERAHVAAVAGDARVDSHLLRGISGSFRAATGCRLLLGAIRRRRLGKAGRDLLVRGALHLCRRLGGVAGWRGLVARLASQ
mmetsp:Transcript_15502/g.39828  ORF Transcript_15502/g.39828 Transcript_15502/m.39828 type:complete len:347 (+) Transcript_15502:943-1983(+)